MSLVNRGAVPVTAWRPVHARLGTASGPPRGGARHVVGASLWRSTGGHGGCRRARRVLAARVVRPQTDVDSAEREHEASTHEEVSCEEDAASADAILPAEAWLRCTKLRASFSPFTSSFR